MSVPLRGVLGAVLAGGGSRRMGRDKALLPFGGSTLLERALETMTAVFEEVVVAAPPRPTYRHLGVPVIADEVPEVGPLGGLHSVLRFARRRGLGGGVFLLACDLPFISPELVRHVIASPSPQPEDNGETGGWVRVPELAGDRQPLCAHYSPECQKEVRHALAARRLAMRQLLAGLRTLPVPLTPDLPFYRPDLLFNINSVEEYRRLLGD